MTLAAVLAVGSAATTAFVVVADRTHTAYARYLVDAEVADVVVNPGLLTDDIDAVLRSLPGIRSVRADQVLLATIDDGAPRRGTDLHVTLEFQVRSSADGRYVESDRPTVVAGRLPTGEEEAFLGVEAADALGVEVGDPLPLAFWWGGLANGPTRAQVEPLGVERVTVVGIGTLPDEVLPDDLYPRRRVLVSPDVTAPYVCVPSTLSAGGVTVGRYEAAVYPTDCAVLYAYYSLDLDGGAEAIDRAATAFAERAAPLNRTLAPEIRDANFGFFFVSTTTAAERQRVEHALRPTVTVARLAAAVSAAAALVLVLLLSARVVRRGRSIAEAFKVFGSTRSARAVGLLAPLVAVAAAALAAGAVAAAPLVALGPLGEVRSVEPDPGPYFDAPRALAVAAALLAVVLLGVGVVAWRGARAGAVRVPPRRPTGRVAALAAALPVPVAQGVTAVVDRRGGVDGPLALAGAVASVTATVAAVVFGASLSSLLDHPERFGWPADAAAVVGLGYGGIDDEVVREDLTGRPDVEAWSTVAASPDVLVEGRPVPAIIDFGPASLFEGAVVAGRLPRTGDEVGLGSKTADDLGLGVGSITRLGGVFGERDVRVAGLLAMPAFGAALSDRSGLGIGLYGTGALAGENGAGSAGFGSLVLVRLADGRAGADRLWDALTIRTTRWDTFGDTPFTHRRPVRPPEIANVEGMRRAPLLLAGGLALGVVLGMASILALSVRGRRGDLAVLRVLGLTGAQVRRSIRWQALTTVAAGLVLGLVLGVAAGGWSWRTFAADLGVAPGSVVPVGSLAAVIVGALAVAVGLAARPAWAATRVSPAQVLRDP